MTAPVFRFAPSPNGELHLGHAYSALLNQEMASAAGGRLLLRIEDIDEERSTHAFEQAIYRDLDWLGIEWERPVRRQSDHFADYRAALDRLRAKGLIYPAFMSRGEARAAIAEREASGGSWPRDPDGAPHYPGDDRTLSERERRRRIDAGMPHSWRLDVAKAVRGLDVDLSFEEQGEVTAATTPIHPLSASLRSAPLPLERGEDTPSSMQRLSSPPDGGRGAERSEAERGASRLGEGVRPTTLDPLAWGDVVIARSDIPTSYHLSVTVDDGGQGVTHIVRGRDLFHATAVHRLLQALLGLPTPVYHHHRLILGDDGRKLSKSRRDVSLDALRQAGATPDKIREMVGLDQPVQPGLETRQHGD